MKFLITQFACNIYTRQYVISDLNFINVSVVLYHLVIGVLGSLEPLHCIVMILNYSLVVVVYK